MRNFDVDVVGAADSVTGNVMVMLVVLILMSAWVSGRVWDIRRHG